MALQENTDLHIVEVHKEYGPIIIDIDISQNENNRKYNIETIKLILKTYNKYINKYIDISNLDYKIYITEKDTPTQKSVKHFSFTGSCRIFQCSNPFMMTSIVFNNKMHVQRTKKEYFG